MHEYSLVQSLVGRVEEEARRHQATAVHGLKVSVGELSGVDADLLRSAYELFRAGTVCEKAELEVVHVAARWACPSCDRSFARGDVLRCERCDRPAKLNERSDEILLESIDLEVP